MDYQIGLCFVNFLIVAFSISDSSQFYSVDLDSHSFNDAQHLCATDGSLANMPTEEETKNILKVIEDKRDTTSTSFWIGLKKNRTQCVLENLLLRGFYWTVDNSSKFYLNKWKEEPQSTCISTLCGLLSVEYRGSSLVSWGLAAERCTKKYPFICKHKASNANIACSSKPEMLGDHFTTEKNNDPYTLWVSCNGTDTFTLTCSKSTGEWKLVGGTGTDIQGLCLKCKNGYKKDKDGKCVDVDECKQSNKCTFHCFNTEGSYSCMCVDEMNNFHNEDSEICKKQKQANTFNVISATDATKKIQDEPTSSSIPFSSQPDADSTVESHFPTKENTGDLSNIIIPLIIALLSFIVLVVIIVAIVKYCLMRRARKRAKERAAAMKESVALNGSDSMEKVNE